MAGRTVLIHEYVTGGGRAGQDLPRSLAAEGHAMRRALAADFAAVPGVRVRMTLDARLPDEPGPWEAVAVATGEEQPTLRRLAEEVDAVLVVAPETDGLLARRSAMLLGAPARWLGSTPAAIALAGDKLRAARRLADAGIATPESVAVSSPDDLPDRLGYPAVLKPIDGAGAVETYLMDGPDALPSGAFRHPPALVQPYVPGKPLSASFLVDASGRPHLIGVGRQRVEVRDGRFAYLGGLVPAGVPALAGAARRAVEAVPGLRGWVGVDFVREADTGRAVVLEINPRATTSFVGLARLLPAGTLAGAWLDAFDRPEALDALKLAGRVHRAAPVGFAADGAPVVDEEEGPR